VTLARKDLKRKDVAEAPEKESEEAALPLLDGSNMKKGETRGNHPGHNGHVRI